MYLLYTRHLHWYLKEPYVLKNKHWTCLSGQVAVKNIANCLETFKEFQSSFLPGAAPKSIVR